MFRPILLVSLVAATLFAFTGITGESEATPSSGLEVGHWSFDEGTGTSVSDSSPEGNDGSITAGSCPVTINCPWVSGWPDGSPFALKFAGYAGTGIDHVAVPHDASLNFDGFMILSAWVAPTQEANSLIPVVMKGDSSAPYGLYISSGKVQFTANNATGGTEFSATTDETIPFEVWSHIAAIYDESTVRLYINGDLKKTVAVSHAIVNNNEPVFIGYDPPGFAEKFRGFIDDVIIQKVTGSDSDGDGLPDGVEPPPFLSSAPVCLYNGHTSKDLPHLGASRWPIFDHPMAEPPLTLSISLTWWDSLGKRHKNTIPLAGLSEIKSTPAGVVEWKFIKATGPGGPPPLPPFPPLPNNQAAEKVPAPAGTDAIAIRGVEDGPDRTIHWVFQLKVNTTIVDKTVDPPTEMVVLGFKACELDEIHEDAGFKVPPFKELPLLWMGPVGGTTELLVGGPDAPAESAGSSGDSTLPIAAATGGLLMVLAGGGFYARRRWMR